MSDHELMNPWGVDDDGDIYPDEFPDGYEARKRTGAPVIGRRVQMVSQVSGAGPDVIVSRTQLISMRDSRPRQWLVTFGQAATPNGGNPWEQNFDGQPNFFVGAGLFNAPAVPSNTASTGAVLQVLMRWAAGGASAETRFDYPQLGNSFSVTADSLDINVAPRSDVAQNPMAPELVPVVSAWMVPGRAADPTPLRWSEDRVSFGAGESRWWSLKPFARRLRIVAPLATSIAGQFIAQAGAAFGTQGLRTIRGVQAAAGLGVDIVVDIPAAAQVFSLTNTSAVGSDVYVESYIGFV